ncbi:DUF2892 domain-containing protein [Skermania sp. ID1734]|nr:DUF2892 domain-containing protein [Skermania sp. ID1734]
MNLPGDRLVPIVGGACVMLSTLMAVLVTPWSLAVTAFIGANLVFYGALGWCPATLLLQRFGIRQACPATAMRSQKSSSARAE